MLAFSSEILIDTSFRISYIQKLQYYLNIVKDMLKICDILLDEIFFRFGQISTFVLQIDEPIFVLVQNIELDLLGLRKGLLVLVKKLLLEGEHVGQELIFFGFPVSQSIAFHFASFPSHTFVVLLDPPLDLVLDFKGSSLGGTTFRLIGKLHHGKYIIFNNRNRAAIIDISVITSCSCDCC